MTQYGVALFYTTSAVMRTEKLLIKKGYTIKLIPTPRQLSSDCGISIRFDWNQQDQIEALLNEAKIEFDSIHVIEV